ATTIHMTASHMIALIIPYVFFFSSRRRHTRSLRDWSSDVCSSDLVFLQRCAFGCAVRKLVMDKRTRQHLAMLTCRHKKTKAGRRSEERRVGKECRSRRPPEH